MDFEVEDVTTWAPDDEEWQGDQSKVWLTPPGSSDREERRRWLFKPSRRVELRDNLDRLRDYTWFDAQSELIAFELAQQLGIPSATIGLVRRRGIFGCISRDVSSRNEDLHSGDTYLSGLAIPGYIPNAERPRNRIGHSLEAIGRVLDGLEGPVAGPDLDARSVFAGYLMLDAWIGNSDRHAENWALTVDADVCRLAASFDHGSSLGAGIEDHVLAVTSPREFARRGMAKKFDEGKNETLVALAHDARRRWGGPWIDRLGHVESSGEQAIVDRVPGLSDVRRTFITGVLEENRRRLLEI